ncbi:hypothetical protein [Acinetobacter sp. 'aerobic (ED)']|uniref:hypothetical protein n=1 Tax=Acinetobacter sp. 'aerobic (ED)' TaxID=174230 RepID=UPI00192B0AB6|nr:hypothetical protein [Acinetobacter sp. 'aerobic (ED)']
MGISIIVYNDENETKSFYLGSFSALFSQLNRSKLENMPVFGKLIDSSNNEDEFFIENEDLIKFMKEIVQLLNNSIYLSENLKGSLEDFLSFFKDKKINSWKLSIA